MLGDGPQAGEKGPEEAEHSTQVGLPDLPGPGYSHHGVVGAAGLGRFQPGDRIGNKKPTQKNPKKPTKMGFSGFFIFFIFWKLYKLFSLKQIFNEPIRYKLLFIYKKNSKVCTQLKIFQKEIKSTLNQDLIHIIGERG